MMNEYRKTSKIIFSFKNKWENITEKNITEKKQR